MDWHRWFPGLYSEATLHLTLEQDAIYRRLIDWYMVNRVPLPQHGAAMARICQISLEKWEEHSSVIFGFFRLKGDKYHHKRCDIELDRQDRTSKKLSEAAKKSAESRSKTSEISTTYELRPSQVEAKAAIEEKRGDVEENPILTDRNIHTHTNGASHARQRRKSATFIPGDFRPDIGSIALAGELGLNAESECREFVDYWKGDGRPKADWQATFRNRLRTVAKYRAERAERQSSGRQGTRDVTGAALRVTARMQKDH